MSLYWFGHRVVDVVGYYDVGDGLGLYARLLIEGDPRPRCAFASMLEVSSR